MCIGALIDHFAVLSCHIGSNERICVAAARCTQRCCDTWCSDTRTHVGCTRDLGNGPACTARKNRHQRTILHNFLGDSRVRFFVQEAKRKICIFCVSWRSVMNFVRESLFAGARRKSGSVCRRAFATTNSDGGMPGRMVRSQDPNESQTSLVAATARYWSNPWATTPAWMKA